MRNPLQEQLLKAGLTTKSKVSQAVREQTKQRQGKAPAPPSADKVDAARLKAEKAERDRAIEAERKAAAQAGEIRAQIRQIIQTNTVKREGELDYRFTDGDRIKSILVNELLRTQLSRGVLVIARDGDGYALIPRAAADKVHARDASYIVLDHGTPGQPSADDEDDYYKQFQVPDDLMW
ncbi:hypothetical protein FHW69_001083 [Luteibacter sp. Sphag1AF]|uniref:DUF2058 domain-containing protein n=1 Tax=Luteibacter sp. Sphag1AF TaxID=2587031 RepID=UPI0016219A7F|nr:DUF2058 domain-containing protein [Luteibacter sp. Sphag1AF]MBB3226493.1 hypothetical protein [Luteibacter sp. Sphag1AF]